MSASAVFRTVRELGFNARRIGLLRHLPRFMHDLWQWKRSGGVITTLFPVLHNWSEQAGSGSGAYFFQDLVVARKVFNARPYRHVDVGSRVDGFVAHIAVFRPVDVVDIRPLNSSIPNVTFLQADLMNGAPDLRGSTDSLSCLHALEHFGLGRYGDPVNPRGHLRGFQTLVDMLRVGGTLYLSFPIGRPAVEFNAHRIFASDEVLRWPGAELLKLEAFEYVDDAGDLHENALAELRASRLSLTHGCGIYTFRKLRDSSDRRVLA